MSELQLGLLAIGALVVAALFAYNRVQESRAARAAQRAFSSTHGDALLEGEARAGGAQRAATPRSAPLPDARIDYVIGIELRSPAHPAAADPHWQPIQRRHAPRTSFAREPGALAWKAGLQLVSRAGSVGEAELIEFRAAVETMAAALGATVTAPEMKAAMEQARELDRLCGETDVQVVLHVVAGQGGAVSMATLEQAAAGSGLVADGEGRYVLRSAEERVIYEATLRDGALSLSLDLPHAPDTPRAFEAMARLAHHLAAACGGHLADDNGNVLGEQAVAAIADQLEQVRGVLDARGIAPGSAVAARLFS